MRSFFYRIFCGFFLGISVFAPGVSGSVIAVMMGIYRHLLDILAHPLRNLRRNFLYLLPMGIGGVASLVAFVLGIGALFDAHERAAYLLFLGLIAGNLPVVFLEARRSGWRPRDLWATALALALSATVGALRASSLSAAASATISLPYAALSGAVGGAVSMAPGMSISMVLMVMGSYNALLSAAKAIDIPVILAAGCCFVLAVVAFSRFTKRAFEKHASIAYSVVLGFMGGSLVGVALGLPPRAPGASVWLEPVLCAVGLLISALFASLSRKIVVEAPGTTV